VTGPGASTRRARVRDHTRETSPEVAIVTAAEQLLETCPLHDLSVSAIIEAAAVSRPTFYFYFPSKYAVVSTLLKRIFDKIEETVQPWFTRAGDESPEATLRVLLHMCAWQWHQHSATIRAAHENAHADAKLGAVWFATLERFRVILCAEIRRARGSADSVGGIDPEVLSATLIWASERTLYMTTRGDDPHLATPEAGAEGLLAIWLPAIYGIPYTTPGSGRTPIEFG
jgi:TetR/AcrR family transcriptional regulator, ethionamide resistance regulator